LVELPGTPGQPVPFIKQLGKQVLPRVPVETATVPGCVETN
jgi:hypothetical protein